MRTGHLDVTSKADDTLNRCEYLAPLGPLSVSNLSPVTVRAWNAIQGPVSLHMRSVTLNFGTSNLLIYEVVQKLRPYPEYP